MTRQLALIVGSLLFVTGCVTTETKSVTPSSTAAESDCQSCVTDARPSKPGARPIEARYLDENNFLLPPGGPRWMPTPKRVRVYFGGQVIADSRNVYLLRESAVPAYYFPESDVKSTLFVPSETTKNAPNRGDATYWSIKVGDRVADDAVWAYKNPIGGAEFLKGYVSFRWDKMDAFFEEKDQVFVHPRDPFLRIDSTHTSQHVKVILNGETVGESDAAVILLEPGQAVRYYLPIGDTRVDLMRPTQTTSRCPYKGLANYYSMTVKGKTYDDIVWSYRAPTLESEKIAGMVSFYNEQVDAILIDGKELPKPKHR